MKSLERNNIDNVLSDVTELADRALRVVMYKYDALQTDLARELKKTIIEEPTPELYRLIGKASGMASVMGWDNEILRLAKLHDAVIEGAYPQANHMQFSWEHR